MPTISLTRLIKQQWIIAKFLCIYILNNVFTIRVGHILKEVNVFTARYIGPTSHLHGKGNTFTVKPVQNGHSKIDKTKV